MSRKVRGPLGRASKRDLWVLRKFAEAVRDWERNAKTGVFSTLYVSEVLGESIFSTRWDDVDRMRTFRERAWARLAKREDYPEIHSAYDLWWLRSNDRAAYETKMLREEVAYLKARIG